MADNLEALSYILLGAEGGAKLMNDLARGDMMSECKLPRNGSNAPVWAKMGVIFGENIEGQLNLYRKAKIPAGWKIVPTDHYMYSHLVDDKGRPRAMIGVKAASYDPWNTIYALGRFNIERVYHTITVTPPKPKKRRVERKIDGNPFLEMDMYGRWPMPITIVEEVQEPTPPPYQTTDRTKLQYAVLDAGKQIYKTSITVVDEDLDSNLKGIEEREAIEKKLQDECKKWLAEHGVTDLDDRTLYWDISL